MNIEKTISEHAVSDILTPMLESQDRIVTEDVAPLFDKATGLDTPPASGTVTTTIEESRNLITAIIRTAWTAALTMLGGASVLSSIAAAYTYLRNRLQGNETYGIPDRRSEISASSPLAANLALLNDRKIGGADVPDGMSIVQLLLTANTYTELKDNTVWGEYQEGYRITNAHTLSKMLSQFPSVAKLSVGWSKVTAVPTPGSNNVVISNSTLTDIDFYALKEVVVRDIGAAFSFPNAVVDFIKLEKLSAYSMSWNGYVGLISNCANETLDFANLQSVTSTGSNSGKTGIVPIASRCTNLKRVLMPKMSAFASDNRIGSQYQIYYFWKCPNIEEIEVGTLTSFNSGNMFYSENNSPLLKLKKVVIGEGTAINLNFTYWEPSAETIADADFLPNFKTYIAERLATFTANGPTLTLSQAVFSEIWDSQGQPQVKEDGLDQLRADIHRIIRTDKQWAVNKA